MISIYILFFTAVIVLFSGLNKSETKFGYLSSILLLFSSVLSVASAKGWLQLEGLSAWAPKNMLYFGPSEYLFSALITFVVAIVLWIFAKNNEVGTDRIGLMLFATIGAIMMVAYQHMVVLFLGLETLSIPLFVLAGSDRERLSSNEAAIKYFLMGAFSTAIFLLGIAFLYGGTGTMELQAIGLKPSFMHALEGMSTPVMIRIGLVLVSIGLLFKVSAAPFHFWSPDVYEGSPNRVMAFMSTVVKSAAFVAFSKLMLAFGGVKSDWDYWIVAIAILTILWGNIAALKQSSVKRTLAYSSIAHAGYLLMYVLIATETSGFMLFVYLLSYALSSIALLAMAHQLQSENEENLNFDVFNGLAKKQPAMALLLSIFVFSTAGIPVTAGFAAKFYLFSSTFASYPLLVFIGLLGSAISIAYYFKFIKSAYLVSATSENTIKENRWVYWLLALVLVAVGVFGAAILQFVAV
jgi:NADH-quinone oxidoreductase subunit N